MGEIKRPFTIMTEYNNKNFRIVPNISEILQAFINGKFILRDFKELYVNEKFQNEKREINFAKEFPLWWFFELEAIIQSAYDKNKLIKNEYKKLAD